MNRLARLLTFGVAVGAFAALAVVPASAQDTTCCQGGTIIEGNFGGDVKTMNPILASDTASQRIISLTQIGFLGVDVDKGAYAPNEPGALVKNWDVSADGKTYTFHLRNDLVWSDGTPITSADVLYTWKAIQAAGKGTVDSPLAYVLAAPGQSGITDVQAPDANTVVVTFSSSECTALGEASALIPAPTQALPADVTQLNDADYNLNPTVTSGPFTFGEFRPGEQVTVNGNPSYKDAIKGVVEPTSYIYKNVPDANVEVDQFLAGQLNLLDTPAVARRADIRASKSQVYSYTGDAWDYLAFNTADPTNPQNALDDKGNPIDQGHHPLFGDVAVRQALSHAIDVNAIIKAALFGEGTQMSSFLIPSSWANDKSLAPITYDTKLAGQMLDAAGFIDDDNDPSTPRVAKGAKYAPDGTKFEFTLYTNDGNARRTAIGQLVQDQLAQIGVKVDFQTIDFNTLLDIMNGQTFDAIILGWRNGYPDDPDATSLFTPTGDVVGSGNNFTSYSNPEFTKLNAQAKSVAGCATADRAPIYQQMEKIMQNDVPYVWLEAQNGMYAAGPNVQGFDPRPDQIIWNVDSWKIGATP
jgi:peptide/nickel transport system substrate-binding protein